MKTVLYVEDDEDDAFFMKRAVKTSGFAVELLHLPNGQAAIERLQGEIASNEGTSPTRADLVLLDINMPKVSGFDVLKWIRNQASLSRLPVFMFTSSGNDADRSRATALGANDYFVKPGNPWAMTELVKKILANSVNARDPDPLPGESRATPAPTR